MEHEKLYMILLIVSTVTFVAWSIISTILYQERNNLMKERNEMLKFKTKLKDVKREI